MMFLRNAQDEIKIAELFLSVDSQRRSNDKFKLPTELRDTLAERLAILKTAENAVAPVKGNRTSAVGQTKDAVANLRQYLRDGYKHIDGIPSFEITPAQRLGAFMAYGWQGGKIGSLLSVTQVLALARQAIAATPTVQFERARYPEALLTRIQEALDIVNENASDALTGERQAAIKTRNEALVALEKINARCRFHYCAASDDCDKTPELARVGYQPRRTSGQRKVKGESDLAGTKSDEGMALSATE